MNKNIERCILCESNDFLLLHPGQDLLHGVEGVFDIAKCKSCGLITVFPRLTLAEVENYYPPNYLSYPMAIEDEKSWFRRLDREYGLKKRCDAIIKRCGNGGRILDIGCATGIFLNGMQKRGWDCYGVEPSKYAATYARERFSLDIFNGYLDATDYPENYFDVVTLWDVLEHIQNPKKTLQIIHKIIKPTGCLIISMPNASAWERTVFGKYWAGWDVPRHYNIFTPTTITHLLNKFSFNTNEITSFTGRHGFMVLSVLFYLNSKAPPLKIKKIILGIIKSVPSRILTYPYYIIADSINRSSIMTIFAQPNQTDIQNNSA